MKISKHAIERWRERSGASYSDEKVERKLLGLAARAEEVQLQEKYRVLTLMDHRYKEARYLAFGEFLMVIVDDTMVTVHLAEARRWVF